MQRGEENEALKSLPSIVVALGDGKRFEGARRERNLIKQAKKKKGREESWWSKREESGGFYL